MIAAQYAIPLPADYEMTRIRRRVVERGAAFDALPGLGLKAFLIRERGVAGATGNEYAPFYLWTSQEAFAAFLTGPLFAAVMTAFGRPVVECWTGLDFMSGPAADRMPLSATREIIHLPPDAALDQLVASERETQRQVVRDADVHSSTLAIDATRWRLIRFTLHARPQITLAVRGAAVSYEVLRTATPDAPGLASRDRR